jgi:hypothetical protein
VIESGGNQTLAVAGQTHEEFIATRVGVGVRPRRSAVGGFLDDAVACDVNCAVDRNRRPERRLDGGVTECPDIAVRAGLDCGIFVQSKSAGEKFGACPGAGCERNRRGRSRWRRPSNGITTDANAIIPDGNVASAGVAETVEVYSATGFAAGPFDAVRAG